MLRLSELRSCDGLLFIGDPHVWSKKPGKRLDEDFCQTVCGKLEQACAIANEMNLLPVILGDLFDDDHDSDPEMLTRVIRALSSSKMRPMTIVGNHEKTQFYLTDDTALAALREARVLATLERAGVFEVLNIGGTRVGLGGSPYGQDIPESVKKERKQAGCDWLIWLTHHDLAFDGAYPGAQEIHEVEGAEMLVNGHMHKPQKPIKVGEMMAFNPGNITRMSDDCRDQEPSVWIWKPDFGQRLEQRKLIFKRDVFNLAGKMFEPLAPSAEETQAMELAQKSRFAQLLKERQLDDQERTDDGAYLKEDMEGLFVELSSPPPIRAALMSLLEETLADESK